MDRFKNILLPLDVTGEGFHKGEALPRRIKTAIAEACWLATITRSMSRFIT